MNTLIGFILHIFLLCKSNKTIRVCYGKFADKGNNPVV